MPSRYPAREAEDRFHSRYGSGGEYVVANYTTGQANIGHENEAAEQAAVARRASLTSEASAGPRPQTAPAREKSSSGWRNLNKEQKKEMRHQYEPGLGGTGDGPPDVRPSTAGPPPSSSSQRTTTLRTRLPGCSSTSVVMQASAGPHRDAGPFTPRARAGAGMDQTSTSTSHYPSHGGKGVPPPKWAHRSRFEPSLGGTSSGKQSRMAAYKENRLATGAYFSATVAGASLVAKSQGAGPLSEAEARLRPKSAGAGARPALSSASAAAMQKRNATANRPGWQRPASGMALAATRAEL
eukprot:CAMPEP_0181355924 /NCGR_PEP_ID=MMETSP1106-20121128/4155_1 /TAXON_ID=81844 /ORGANISM="Mantoniella antarctica, Strain SL-175" /LENGTH=295 /DNA_ID=CAMNT_0023468689 /DNA_START=29 /DNA_END=912 /DNA_ORIENTATION=+